jgi:hypothetical protein
LREAYLDGTLRVRGEEERDAYVSIRQHTSAYVSIRQHTSAYVSNRQHTSAYAYLDAIDGVRGEEERAAAPPPHRMRLHPLHLRVSIRQHSSAYVSIRRHTSAYLHSLHLLVDEVKHQLVVYVLALCQPLPACIRQHTSAFVSIRQRA